MLAANLDYLIFAATAVCGFALLRWGMQRRQVGFPKTIWLVLGVTIIAGWFPVNQAGKNERKHSEEMVSGMAPTYSQALELMGHANIGLDTAGDDPAYLAMLETEKRWLKANPGAHDIYTMRKLSDGKNVFIVDSETDYDGNGIYDDEREQRTDIGEVFDEEDPGLERAFAGEANFDEEPITDRWGTWVTAWAPLRDENGKVEAVLGVDYDAESWVSAIAAARRARIVNLGVLLVIIGGSILAINALRADIAKRKRIEQELRQSQQRLALRAEQTPLAMIEWNLDGRVTDWNAAAERLFGYSREEALGSGMAELALPEPIREEIESLCRGIVEKKTIRAGEDDRITRDGRLITCEWFNAPLIDERTGKVVAVTSLVEDTTDRRQLEDQLRQAQKMEAVGQLAGGVAHDFNNMLCVIQGYTDLVRNRENLPAEMLADLNQIAASADRAAGLTRQLLTFSRRQVFQPKDLNLNEIVGNVAKMLRRVLGEHIHLDTNLIPRLPEVHADAGMLEQVLLNLTVNARDAMPKGGRLVITTSTHFVTEDEAARHPEVVPGPFVRLDVADGGSGIASEHLPQIFDPFFTTKEVGRGTGLGLATVYGIVQQHRGWIEVDTELGRGTTFHIHLPAVAVPGDSSAVPRESEPLRGGHETILLVEDEPPVRDFVSRVLKLHGYEVLAAASGAEAIDVWRQHQAQISLLLTDMIMPEGISGADLARRLQGEAAALKVIYTSGYSTEFVGRNVTLEPGINFLQKPYQTQELLQTVRNYLD